MVIPSLQKINENVDPVIWAIGIRILNGKRDKIIDTLKSKGIETRPGFYSFADQPLYNTIPLSNSSLIANEVICLPFFLDLRDNQTDLICDEFIKSLNNI